MGYKFRLKFLTQLTKLWISHKLLLLRLLCLKCRLSLNRQLRLPRTQLPMHLSKQQLRLQMLQLRLSHCSHQCHPPIWLIQTYQSKQLQSLPHQSLSLLPLSLFLPQLPQLPHQSPLNPCLPLLLPTSYSPSCNPIHPNPKLLPLKSQFLPLKQLSIICQPPKLPKSFPSPPTQYFGQSQFHKQFWSHKSNHFIYLSHSMPTKHVTLNHFMVLTILTFINPYCQIFSLLFLKMDYHSLAATILTFLCILTMANYSFMELWHRRGNYAKSTAINNISML